MGLSAPSAQYIIELAKLFHCTADYILELDNKKVIDISKYNKNEAKPIRDLISYIDNRKKIKKGVILRLPVHPASSGQEVTPLHTNYNMTF